MPRCRLGRGDGWSSLCAKHGLQRFNFPGIANRRRCGVCVDVANTIRSDSRHRQAQLHCPHGTGTISRTGRHVISICGRSIANDFCYRAGTACHGMVQRLYHQHGRTFTHHKPVTVAIEWARCAYRLIVKTGRQSLRRRESAETHFIESRFAPACQHNIGLPCPN